MSAENLTPDTERAFCLDCGYALRDLPTARCPECGRTFDPANPRTVSLGGPLRRWQRWLLKPTAWPTILLAVLGAGALAYVSRWPRLSIEPVSVLIGEFHRPRPGTLPPTILDVVFYVAVVCWLLFLIGTVPRLLARLALISRARRRAKIWQIDTRRRCLVIAIAAILSIVCMIFGWQSRVGGRWVVRLITPSPNANQFSRANSSWDPWRSSPVELTPEQANAALDNLVVELPTPIGRFAALHALVEATGRASLPSLLHAAETETMPDLLVCELRLIGLCRDPKTAPMLLARLKDPRPAVRAAAIDAIGILRHPSYSVYEPNGFYLSEPLALNTSSPIGIGRVVSTSPSKGISFNGGLAEHDLADDPPIAVDPALRGTFEQIMLAGETSEERDAAARALVDWPPANYRFRIAEWGVWINYSGHMALAQSVLDEIPPFVHRTGNPLSTFGSYFLYPSIVTKPIVHLTVDRPLVVDLEVHISEGRPWFAYPLPDDFGIGVDPEEEMARPLGSVSGFMVSQATQPTSDNYGTPPIAAIKDLREGYPWLLPGHRLYSSWQGNPLIYRLGLRWQSAVLTPDRLPWMILPIIDGAAKFNWWQQLRQVPSSWVTNRGETERFLYYDGPTRSKVPITVSIDGGRRELHFIRSDLHPTIIDYRLRKPSFAPLAMTQPRVPDHEGLYIEVRDGHVSARAMPIPGDGSIPLKLDDGLVGEDAASGRLREMLVQYGLTGPEADGLIASWAPQFFRTEGRRFILRMSPSEYARQCPMQVRPTPTEVVRLGLVLTEFDNQLTTQPAAR